jgi:phospholipid/cholesterol/gamma-HCH transport system permease protein
MQQRRNLPEMRFVKHFHDHPAYIDALARRVSDHWMMHGRPDRLVLSFHGLPKRSLTLGDPYHCECLKTGRLLTERLKLREDNVVVTFQRAVLALQSGLTLDQFGARPVVGRLVSATMVKELGPVLTSLMLAGRVGSGIAAELGSMVVTDQINALRALGTDPIRKLVVPRVIAGVVMAPILTVISDFIGIIGGGIIAVVQLQVASTQYWKSVTDGLYVQDAWMGLIKPIFLGFIIVSIGCHVGLRTKGGTQGVGRSTTNAVVAASVAVLAADFFLTRVLITLLY